MSEKKTDLNQRAREEAAEQDKIADVCNWNDKENTARKVAQLLRDLADENERLRSELQSFRETAAMKAEWSRQALESKPMRDKPRPHMNSSGREGYGD